MSAVKVAERFFTLETRSLEGLIVVEHCGDFWDQLDGVYLVFNPKLIDQYVQYFDRSRDPAIVQRMKDELQDNPQETLRRGVVEKGTSFTEEIMAWYAGVKSIIFRAFGTEEVREEDRLLRKKSSTSETIETQSKAEDSPSVGLFSDKEPTLSHTEEIIPNPVIPDNLEAHVDTDNLGSLAEEAPKEKPNQEPEQVWDLWGEAEATDTTPETEESSSGSVPPDEDLISPLMESSSPAEVEDNPHSTETGDILREAPPSDQDFLAEASEETRDPSREEISHSSPLREDSYSMSSVISHAQPQEEPKMAQGNDLFDEESPALSFLASAQEQGAAVESSPAIQTVGGTDIQSLEAALVAVFGKDIDRFNETRLGVLKFFEMLTGKRSLRDKDLLTDEGYQGLLVYLKSLPPELMSKIFFVVFERFWRFGEVELVSSFAREIVQYLEERD